MESKSTRSSATKKRYPSILGVIFVSVFNLILLSMLSWVLLALWFYIQLILSNSENVTAVVQKIVESQDAVIASYQSVFLSSIINLSEYLQHIINHEFEHYIGLNISAILIGTFEITLTRFSLFVAFLPFMFVIIFVLVIDGLVQRDIRKFKGSRESTFLFHRLKPMAQFSFFSLFFLYMTLPVRISPEACLLPMMILSGLFMMFTIKSFKKYL